LIVLATTLLLASIADDLPSPVPTSARQGDPQPASITPAVVVFSGPAMGTLYSVQVVMNPGDAAAKGRAQTAIDRELALVDRLFSKWNPESELSRFNAHGSSEPFAVSAEMVEVVLIAGRAAEKTGGAFDATVAPLVEAWGFGPGGRPPGTPSPDVVAAARARVGYALLSADPARLTIRKTRPDVAIDLDGLVGGWLADGIAAALAALGYGDVLVDAGGELAARGHSASGGHWRIAVESPAGARARAPTITLDDAAVATSGDYRKFWTDDEGRRRSHIIDPRTGQPIAHGLASATVVHANGAWADAIGTALLVLGPAEARAFAMREHLAARLVERLPDGSWACWSSPPFDALAGR
jgi:thiamine biosynthesis lipoprotein